MLLLGGRNALYFVQGPVGSVQGLFASRYFRSSELGTFAPRNESSRELSLPGTFIPGNFRSWERHTAWDSSAHDQHPQRDITLQQSLRLYRKINDECSRELLFPGTFVPGIVSSLSDHGNGCWRWNYSESKSKKYSKMNANNTYLHYCWIRLRLLHTVNVNVPRRICK